MIASTVCSITPATAPAPPASFMTTWDRLSTITSSPGRVWAASEARLPMVPLGTNTAASLPRRAAISSSSRRTVGSSPHTSSPTSASAMTRRISASGVVKVSLRRSTGTDDAGDIAGNLRVGVVIAGHAHPVATGVLGIVEGGVGRRQEFLRRGGVLGVGGAPDAHGQRHRLPAAVDGNHDGLGGGADLLGDHARIGRGGVRHDHDELLAAVAGGEVDAPDAVVERLREGGEHDVADRVALGVVDPLEVVEVDDEDGERGVETFGEGQLLAEAVDEEAVVVQPGEVVDACLALDHGDEAVALQREASIDDLT